MGDDVGAAELGRRLGDSLRRLRKARDWSFDDLALASGVSRAALSQIETYRTNPSLAVLWKIAVGLKVPFQELLGPPDAGNARLLKASETTVLRSLDGRLESRLLSPTGAMPRMEVYELRFKAHGALQSEPHGSGVHETVIVLTGVLRITERDQKHDLAPGDSLYFEANAPHVYENRSSAECRCIDIIAYGSPY